MIDPLPRARKGWTRVDAAAVAVLVAIGIAKLLLPFTGDQALFVTGGRELIDGATLYDGVWDVKQPGIYWFGSASAALFGRSELGFTRRVSRDRPRGCARRARPRPTP